MASQGQVSGSIILGNKMQEQLNHFISPSSDKQKEKKNFTLESSLVQHGFLFGKKKNVAVA